MSYKKWVEEAYKESINEVLKNKSDDYKNAVLNNPRKNVFIERMLKEIRGLELSKPLIFLTEKKIKDAVKTYCDLHFSLLIKSIDVQFGNEVIKRVASEENFKIDEQTGIEYLDME